ncbi:predicted protein [Naegleria gruberi]|uniref:Predicted protein n=1 Tax=Naegleria gruberi TaxID=5762 RepID=D2VRJ1_NAEGR|nr:uncharacterized protein NAEGRDRAFT_71602 [Naegleria gruberi]EFC40611.1 predicted protein [Naegleria gruberi]|eukprot:XP_002673355.1 predicted protein [Naegleria gruberi strain NEG-M]
MNVEICNYQDDDSDSIKIEIYTHNCNPYSWYDLNNTPQGFFSDYKIEHLFRDLTNTLRINVHQAPVPSLFYRHKLFNQTIDNVFLPNEVSKFIESRTKFTTMKVYLPKENNSIKVETDIGNIIFRNLKNLNECFVKSSFGSLYIDKDGIDNVKKFNLEMLYGSCFIKKVSNVENLKINHLFSLIDHFGRGAGILASNSITLDNIDSNSNVNIHTIDPIDIFVNQISLTNNNTLSISCRTKDGTLFTYTSNGIQVFVSDEVNSGTNSKLKIFSDSNPITCYFDKNSVVNYKVQAVSQRSDVSVDYNNIIFDGSDVVNSVNGTIVSRKDTKRLHLLNQSIIDSPQEENIDTTATDLSSLTECPIGGDVSMTCRHSQIHIKQYEYLLLGDGEQGADSDLSTRRLLYQKQSTSEYYIELLDYRIAKRDAFVYVSIAVLLIIYVSIIKFYSIPTFEKQAWLNNSGMASTMGNPTEALRPNTK